MPARPTSRRSSSSGTRRADGGSTARTPTLRADGAGAVDHSLRQSSLSLLSALVGMGGRAGGSRQRAIGFAGQGSSRLAGGSFVGKHLEGGGINAQTALQWRFGP